MSGTFLYFAYGSNLSKRRIQKNNSSAKRISVAILRDYRLDFITYASGWGGAVATIVPHEGHTVWGALWEISLNDLPNLERQEGVQHNVYYSKEVEVILPDGSTRFCRTYIQTSLPNYVEDIRNLPEDRRPSSRYLRTILEGAVETGISGKYLEFLKKIPQGNEN